MRKIGFLILFLISLCARPRLPYRLSRFLYPEVSFRPTSARIEAMGGTESTADGDVLYYNPITWDQEFS